TGEVRRLAHHRSRGMAGGSYYYQPRVNASWDGTQVAWSSNFGLNSPDYSDIYSIVVGTSGTPSSGPTVSFTNPASGATVSGTTTVTMTASGSSGYTYTLKVDGALIY